MRVWEAVDNCIILLSLPGSSLCGYWDGSLSHFMFTWEKRVRKMLALIKSAVFLSFDTLHFPLR